MWQHTNLIGTIPATIIDIPRNITARLIDIHKLMDNHVAIITQTDIKIIQFNLRTETIYWKLTSITKFHLSSHVSFSCVSPSKIYLAVLSESYELALYYFYKNRTVLPPYIEMNKEPHFIYKFPWKVTCCDISQNEQYIAVGTEKGQICVSLFHDLVRLSSSVTCLYEFNFIFFSFLDYGYNKTNRDHSIIFPQRSHYTIVLGSDCYRCFDFTISNK